MHLADAFIQSDLQCIQAIHLYCQYSVFVLSLPSLNENNMLKCCEIDEDTFLIGFIDIS